MFAFLQNTDPLDHRDIEVTAWHDTFGIGIREKALAIVQPEPITVPARRGDTPGVAAVNFSLITPPSGRGRLALKVVPYGPALVQPVALWRRRRGPTVDPWPSIPGRPCTRRGSRELVVSRLSLVVGQSSPCAGRVPLPPPIVNLS